MLCFICSKGACKKACLVDDRAVQFMQAKRESLQGRHSSPCRQSPEKSAHAKVSREIYLWQMARCKELDMSRLQCQDIKSHCAVTFPFFVRLSLRPIRSMPSSVKLSAACHSVPPSACHKVSSRCRGSCRAAINPLCCEAPCAAENSFFATKLQAVN